MISNYNIYINGRLEAQNIAMDEKDATVAKLIDALKDIGASDEDKQLLAEIEDGATVEIKDEYEVACDEAFDYLCSLSAPSELNLNDYVEDKYDYMDEADRKQIKEDVWADFTNPIYNY